jgi:hypothetical protein
MCCLVILENAENLFGNNNVEMSQSNSQMTTSNDKKNTSRDNILLPCEDFQENEGTEETSYAKGK